MGVSTPKGESPDHTSEAIADVLAEFDVLNLESVKPAALRTALGALAAEVLNLRAETKDQAARVTSLTDTSTRLIGERNAAIEQRNEAVKRAELAEANGTRDLLTGFKSFEALQIDLNFMLAVINGGVTERRAGYGTKDTLLFLDLDNFKPVNDRFGHGFGNYLLQVMSERMRAGYRDGDIYRFGGDEFCVTPEGENIDFAMLTARIVGIIEGSAEFIASQARDPEALEVLRTLCKKSARQMTPDDLATFMISTLQNVSASAGVLKLRRGMSIEEVLVEVDDLMYEIKEAKKARQKTVPTQR